jgi:hypothetical protein
MMRTAVQDLVGNTVQRKGDDDRIGSLRRVGLENAVGNEVRVEACGFKAAL